MKVKIITKEHKIKTDGSQRKVYIGIVSHSQQIKQGHDIANRYAILKAKWD